MSKPEIISGKSGFITRYPMYPYTHHNFIHPFVNPRIRQFPKQTRPLQLSAADAHRVNKAIKQPLLPMRQAASRRGRRLTSRLPSMIYSRGVGAGDAPDAATRRAGARSPERTRHRHYSALLLTCLAASALCSSPTPAAGRRTSGSSCNCNACIPESLTLFPSVFYLRR
jgi:hypothetical protein